MYFNKCFCVVRVMSTARERVAEHIPAETNARDSGLSIDRQRRCKQVLSATEGVFSVGYMQNIYKRVEFRSLQFSSVQFSNSVELRVQLWSANQRRRERKNLRC
jgi:hypothetical protein